MGRIFLTLGILFVAQYAGADYLRTRDELGKSSFSAVSTVNVALSTSSSFVRSITFSGAAPSTVTIYNRQLWSLDVTTKCQVYWPGGQTEPTTVPVNVNNSSGTIIHKNGAALTYYLWDWYTRPVDPVNGEPIANPLNEDN